MNYTIETKRTTERSIKNVKLIITGKNQVL